MNIIVHAEENLCWITVNVFGATVHSLHSVVLFQPNVFCPMYMYSYKKIRTSVTPSGFPNYLILLRWQFISHLFILLLAFLSQCYKITSELSDNKMHISRLFDALLAMQESFESQKQLWKGIYLPPMPTNYYCLPFSNILLVRSRKREKASPFT